MDYTLNFICEEGTEKFDDVTVYALSTCGFCKKALKFLRDNSIKFRYVFVDELDHEIRQRLKEDLAKRFNERMGFPFMVIDNTRCVVGFTEKEWEEIFLKK